MNSTSFQRFNNDLKAALIAGVPLEIGSSDSATGTQCLTTAKLNQFENELLLAVSDENALEHALQSNSEVPSRYLAALQVFERTDCMPIVLDGLTVRLGAQSQVNQALRWTFIYLFFLLAVACAGMWLFISRVLPEIELMRDDLLLPAAVNAPPSFDLTPWFPLILGVFGGGCLILLVLMLTGGVSKIAMWLGGKRFVECRLTMMALRLTKILMDEGMSSGKAITTACDLNGAGDRVRSEIQKTIEATRDGTDLDSLADYLTLAGNDRLAQLKTGTPIAVVSIVGGGIALVYCVAVFWPILSILKDMTTLGT